MSQIKLSIAIVNWNTADITKKCLESIFSTIKKTSFEVIVVDNASTDESVKMIENEFNGITLIKNNENLLFAEPNNQAFQISKGKYFFLLNSDTELHENAVDTLVEYLDENDDVAGVTCKLENPDGTTQYYFHSQLPNSKKVILIWIFGLLKLPKIKLIRNMFYFNADFSKNFIIEQPAGACFILRKDVIKKIGGLFNSKHFPLYYNDVELAYRLQKNSQKLVCVGGASIMHIGGYTTKKKASKASRKVLMAEACLRYFKYNKLWFDYVLIWLSFVFIIGAVIIVHFFYTLIKKSSINDYLKAVKAYVQNVVFNPFLKL